MLKDDEKIKIYIEKNEKVNNKKKQNLYYKYQYFKNLLIILFIILIIIISKIKIEIFEIDNEISLFEKNIDFSNYSTEIKTIALYLPQFHSIKENDKWWGKGFTEWTNVKKAMPLYKGQYQPRIPRCEYDYLCYYNLTNPDTIKKQVELAKSHGIYGFGIYYYWFSGKRLLEKPLDIIINHKEINFKFLLIWANENWTKKWDGKNNEILIKQEYKEKDPKDFINDIKKYLLDLRYIKMKEKKVIGIYEPFKIPNFNKTISIWRRQSRKLGIGELFILICLNHYKINDFQNLNIFDGAYEFPPRDSLGYKINNKPYFLYTATLYKDQNFININGNFFVFRGSMLEFDNTPRKKNSVIFENYSPEQIYMINKKIITWTREKYNKDDRFIFINAWNEWGEGTYLEPDNKYGFASINSLSKALFNFPYIENNLNISKFNINSSILVLAYIYNETLIKEIIDKTNNIPMNFDIYFLINNLVKKEIIEQNIYNYSKVKKFEIINYENNKNNITSIVVILKYIIKNYKYLCHIQDQIYKYNYLNDDLKNYLLNNLLGNTNIIKEIINDFEYNFKLGFIFPEIYYKILLQYGEMPLRLDKIKMKYLFKKLFNGFKFGSKIVIPVGNMFWSKTKAIYPFFEKKIDKTIYKKPTLKNNSLCIFENIWLYIIKSNGFYYKKIFKSF